MQSTDDYFFKHEGEPMLTALKDFARACKAADRDFEYELELLKDNL